jgi:fatty acid elongase 3
LRAASTGFKPPATSAHALYRLLCYSPTLSSLFKFLAGGGALSSLFCESFDSSNQPPPGSNTLFFWCYLFYLSKYYDFFDTLLLVLRKKDLGFLHMYHHASLPLLCVLTMSNWRLPVWTGAIINSGVHVVMYYYFGLRMAFPDRKIWWRKYVTVIQILQFTLGFVFIAYFLTIFVVGVTIAENGSAFSITVERGCSVNPLVVGLNSFVNLSFFVLFVQIYIRDNFSNTKPKVSGKNSTPALCVPTQQDGGKKHV